jgi:RIO-like serine/threonine protein kinase
MTRVFDLEDTAFYQVFTSTKSVLGNDSDEDEEGGSVVTEYYNDLPNTDPFTRCNRTLGYGDEGVVYQVQNRSRSYAMKIYKVDRGEPNTYQRDHQLLKEIGVAPKLYYIGMYQEELFTLMEIYDFTLDQYLHLHPEQEPHCRAMCEQSLRAMLAEGWFDYDFSLANVMINQDNPDQIYWVDWSIDHADASPDDVEEILDHVRAGL